MLSRRHSIPIALSILGSLSLSTRADDAVDFTRDIRPILAKNCISCHGKASQKSGLRLDLKDKAMAGGDTGEVIVAGKADESLLYRYVAGLDADHLMPPKKSKGPRPTPDEISKLRSWINQGAKWPDDGKSIATEEESSAHWAFQKPIRPTVPTVKDASWPRTPIDNFVLTKLKQEGLKPSPEADKVTLIRRLTLDLTGLPPTIKEVDEFVADQRTDAYERLVDRLLASPRYGERWARRWLDKARYADTNGYEKDRGRSMWPYRDWVINAFNTDMPFDKFTVAQIAGDMLPNATPSDIIATGFHRNTMRNEEGGIDVEEFRYAALVDRVATTGATWLGLTVQCAQCHTHKYDPITQKEYYQFLAFFNNADEPEEYEIPDAKIAEKRAEIASEVAKLESQLESKFPATDQEKDWSNVMLTVVKSHAGAILSVGQNGLVTASGTSPDKDVYTIRLNRPEELAALRLDAVADPSSPAFGPGRTPHGNFVLSGISLAIEQPGKPPIPVPIASATADFTQHSFDPMGTLDDNPQTGWAIDHGSGRCDVTRSATFTLKEWPKVEGSAKLAITLKQEYGGNHTLGRFRLRAKFREQADTSAKTIEEQRREHLSAKLSAWESRLKPHSWTILPVEKAISRKFATMTPKDDGSVLVTGDKPNNDVYDVEVTPKSGRITAIRLETLTDPSMPENGPGRAPLNTIGDFILTEFTAEQIDGDTKKPIKLVDASQDQENTDRPASNAIDDVPETGWTIKGAIGKPHQAVFELAEPITVGDKPIKLALTLHQFGIHNATIGRFRISVTGDDKPIRASSVPAEVEAAALVKPQERSTEQRETLKHHFLSVTPELSAERARIEALQKSAPKYSTTLVMEERAPKHQRTTNVHKRGEFLNLAEPVTPALFAALPVPSAPLRSRLDLAQWLVSNENPLTARVAVNDTWLAFFGRGLVATPEDFGTRGERPSHPELLEWLAVEFPTTGWSTKKLHRLIVTSATYRQSSKARPEMLARDPKNMLLARGSRFRVDAETIRDIALYSSGLLNEKLGGPSVYPPQPEGVSSLAYGQGAWPTSSGADRYRRGLYTFVKRASPFAAFSLMDAPNPEVTCVRRERSNTPLQALTLLNDTAFVDASRSLALRALTEAPEDPKDRAVFIFRACMARKPSDQELAALQAFYQQELNRFRSSKADPSLVVGKDTKGFAADEAATWTLVARAVLNLDETITRE